MGLYEQKYIDSVGEGRLTEILKNGYYVISDGNQMKKVYFDLINDTMDSKKINFAFEHFLIKCYTQGKDSALCAKYLNMYYQDFYKRPYNYVNSPLIKDDVLDTIVNKNSNDKIKNIRNNYYNGAAMNALYKKKKTTPLTEDEENRYYAYLIHIMDSNSDKVKDVIKDEINSIMDENKNIKDINTLKLQFYAQYVSDWAGSLEEKRNFKNVVIIGTNVPNSGGYELKDIICLNQATSYTPTIARFTECVCHETRHSMQEHKSKMDNSLYAFQMAQNQLFNKYLPYDSYHMNYKYSAIELDAERYGYFYTTVLFGMFGKENLKEENIKSKKEYFEKRNDYNYMVGKNKKPYPIDKIITHNLDIVIKNNPQELENFPVLKQIYNKNGERKTFEELLYIKSKENMDNRRSLDNYIYSDISNGKLDSMVINDDKMFEKLFLELDLIYRDKIFSLNEKFYDKEPKVSDKQVYFTTSYELDIIYQILKYANDNFERILDIYKDLHVNNQLGFYDFIMGFRDFEPSKIKNKYLKDNEVILEKMNILKGMTNEIIKKYNYKFVTSRLAELPEQNRNAYISFDGIDMTVYEYFTKVIYPMMDGHQEIHMNGDVYYVGNMIRNIKNYTKVDNLNISMNDKRY